MSWTLIEQKSLSSSTASVTFSSIPQTYKTLKVVMSLRGSSGGVVDGLLISFNGTQATSARRLFGNGSTATSDTSNEYSAVNGGGSTSNTFTSTEFTLPNYTSSTNKAFSTEYAHENNATTAYPGMAAGLSSVTAAITSLTMSHSGANSFVSGSTFTLYGLA